MYRQLSNLTIKQKRQSGVALFISLIFLLVLTIIALSSMDNTLLDSKIVNNQQDKSFSLLMADTVFREPEVWLQNVVKNRLLLENKLCNDTSGPCSSSSLWKKEKLDWTESVVTDSAQWWGDPSSTSWTKLPVVYGVNGGDTYCSGKPNEKQYSTAPSSINDGNNFNNCLANVSVPPTYIVEELMTSGSSGVKSMEVSTGSKSTCAYKINNYFWQTTVLSSGARDTTSSMVRATYVKKC